MDSNLLETARNALAAFQVFLSSLADQFNSPEAQSHVSAALDIVREGFSQVNVAEGLIIAVIAAVAMQSWRGLVATALFATLTHIVLSVLIPVFANGAELRLPTVMEEAFWRTSASLVVGYLIVISILFAAKRLMLRAQPQPAHG